PTRPTPFPYRTLFRSWYPRGGDRGNVNEIHLSSSSGGAGRSVTSSIDRHIARSIWMPDGKALLVGANDGTRVSLWIQPVDGSGADRKSTRLNSSHQIN